MKNVLLCTLLMLFMGISASFAQSPTSGPSPISETKYGTWTSQRKPETRGSFLTVVNGQEADGESLYYINVEGTKIKVCDVDISAGVATITFQSRIGTREWRDINGAVVTTDYQITFAGDYTDIRMTVSTCTNCVVDVYCIYGY